MTQLNQRNEIININSRDITSDSKNVISSEVEVSMRVDLTDTTVVPDAEEVSMRVDLTDTTVVPDAELRMDCNDKGNELEFGDIHVTDAVPEMVLFSGSGALVVDHEDVTRSHAGHSTIQSPVTTQSLSPGEIHQGKYSISKTPTVRMGQYASTADAVHTATQGGVIDHTQDLIRYFPGESCEVGVKNCEDVHDESSSMSSRVSAYDKEEIKEPLTDKFLLGDSETESEVDINSDQLELKSSHHDLLSPPINSAADHFAMQQRSHKDNNLLQSKHSGAVNAVSASNYAHAAAVHNSSNNSSVTPKTLRSAWKTWAIMEAAQQKKNADLSTKSNCGKVDKYSTIAYKTSKGNTRPILSPATFKELLGKLRSENKQIQDDIQQFRDRLTVCCSSDFVHCSFFLI